MKKILEGVWIILAILTIFAFILGHLKFMPIYLVAILLISTFIKGQLVIDYFMGLKKVKLKYRLIPTIWLTVVISLIAILL
ncbi:MAG: hypothetical protein KU29_10565 [Sulfurovum sp. FS06-10]|jgi:hypothetical protein|nr:MAG: hypothetical protein KU29_10565 [Sulfurovum sp. FS06-10]